MKAAALRYPYPIDEPRPRGSRQLEGFSLKLNRPVRTFDRVSFDFWIGLEADPDVVAFCERPVRAEGTNKGAASFWVRRRDSEALVRLEQAGDAASMVAEIGGLAVITVTLAEVAASGVWIANWRRMLPTIIVRRADMSRNLQRSIRAFVAQPVALARIEREFGFGDPGDVRASVFDLIRVGKLTAPSLKTEPLSPLTMMAPAR
jgi:hypothetical protein